MWWVVILNKANYKQIDSASLRYNTHFIQVYILTKNIDQSNK